MGKPAQIRPKVILQHEDGSVDFVEQGIVFHVLEDGKAVCHVLGQVGEQLIASFFRDMGMSEPEIVEAVSRMSRIGFLERDDNFTHPMKSGTENDTDS